MKAENQFFILFVILFIIVPFTIFISQMILQKISRTYFDNCIIVQASTLNTMIFNLFYIAYDIKILM